MPVGTTAAIIGGAGLLSGGLSAFGRQNPMFDMQPAGGLEQAGSKAAMGALGNLNQYAGPFDYSRSAGATNDLASMLQNLSQTGAIPGASDISAANSYANNIFASQRVAQQQAFQDQLQQANRQAALSGRGMNDPILRAKLAQEQTRQSDYLNAQQTGFAAQFAQQLPLQRLQFAEGRANVLTGRDQLEAGARQQAFSNYSNIFQLGNTAQQSGFNQRFQQAYGNYLASKDQTSFAERLGSTINSGISGMGEGMGLTGIQKYLDKPEQFAGTGYNPFQLQMPQFGSGLYQQSSPRLF